MKALIADGAAEWAGKVADMPALYAASTLIAYPTWYGEGVPKVLLKAASSGRANAARFPGRRMVATVGGVAFMSPSVGRQGITQKSAARIAAAVAGSSRPGVWHHRGEARIPSQSAAFAILVPGFRRLLRVAVEDECRPAALGSSQNIPDVVLWLAEREGRLWYISGRISRHKTAALYKTTSPGILSRNRNNKQNSAARLSRENQKARVRRYRYSARICQTCRGAVKVSMKTAYATIKGFEVMRMFNYSRRASSPRGLMRPAAEPRRILSTACSVFGGEKLNVLNALIRGSNPTPTPPATPKAGLNCN